MPEPVQLRASSQAHCKDCTLAPLCLPLSINPADLNALDNIVKRGRPLKRGDYLFRQDTPFDYVSVVRTGALKTFHLNDDGVEQIVGFHLPGELVGLSGVSSGLYPSSAQALETTFMCEIPFDRLEQLSMQLPSFRRQLLHMMSREICHDQQMLMMLAKKSADERIATFLLNLSARFQARGLSAQQFHLSMTRTDLSNYLGLAVETISRVFGRLQRNTYLYAKGREIHLVNMEKLRELSNNCMKIAS